MGRLRGSAPCYRPASGSRSLQGKGEVHCGIDASADARSGIRFSLRSSGLHCSRPRGHLRLRRSRRRPRRCRRGFQEEIVFSGLTQPTAVRFSPDGRVFVAEKSGIIKVFDNLSDTTPTVFADLRTHVHNFWDRGLLGAGARLRTSRRTRGSTSSTPSTPPSAGPRHGGGRWTAHPTAARRRPARPTTAAWSRAASRGCRRPATSPSAPSRCWSRTGASSTRATPSGAGFRCRRRALRQRR